MMTIGSLFSGIGGLELGLEAAGLGPVVWQAETSPFCRSVLEHHWPDAKRFNSAQEVDEHAEVPTIICGGFPCQDVSVAGSGAGLAGNRSGLWREFARCIRILRPKIVVVENVAALLGRGMGDVLGDLSTLGYDAVWDCIPAAAVGAGHRRDRVFVVAWRVSDALGDPLWHEPKRGECSAQEGDGGDTEFAHVGGAVARAERDRPQGQCPAPEDTGRDAGAMAHAERERLQGQHEGGPAEGTTVGGDLDVADGDGGRREGIGLKGLAGRRGEHGPRGDELDGRDLPKWPPAPGDMHAWGQVPAEAFPAFCRMADGLPERLDWIVGQPRRQALRAYGNAVVPAVAEVVGRVIVERFGRNRN